MGSVDARTGAMIALVPTDADLDRLTLDHPDAEPRAELHLTLWFLGEAASHDAAARTALVDAVTGVATEHGAVDAHAFGAAHWNPTGAEPCWVLNVGDRDGDAGLALLRDAVADVWRGSRPLTPPPPQHTPWQPHVCLAYSSADLRAALTERLGDVTFDRVRVAFAGDVTDIPLHHPATVAAALGGDVMPWHKVQDHSECSAGEPWAVVRDATGEVEGCHASEEAADRQLAALYAAEGRESAAVEPCVDCAESHEHFTVELASDQPWNGAASRFTDEQYRRAAAACDAGDAPPKTRCFLPHHEPGGALNRNGVHAAAARLNQVNASAEAVSRARSHLRSHYRQLGEEVPDVLKAEADELAFADRGGDDRDCPPGHHRMPDGSCMSDEEMATASRWSGVLVVEGITTGDGREFAPNALTWAETPLLRWQKEGSHGGQHDVTVSVGRIDDVWRDGNVIRGRGALDLLNADGFELYRRLKNGFAGGVSVDADDISEADVEFIWGDDVNAEEIDEAGDVVKFLFGSPDKMVFHGGRIRAATVVDIPAFVEAYITLGDAETLVAGATASHVHHTETTDEPWTGQPTWTGVSTATRDAYAWSDGDRHELLHHVKSLTGELGPANVTACAAGVKLLTELDLPTDARRVAYEHLATHLRDAGLEPPPLEVTVVTAGALDEWRPPRAWFADPGLSVPTPITVTTQGRVYGHAARWGECHVGYSAECVTVPYEDAHPYFATGEVVCAEGSTVAVGQITVGTGHAPLAYRASRAVEHYDNTGCAVADVAVGNDRHGIWVAGAVRPHVETARVHDLRASGQVSGDWRRIGGQLRLVGLLAVNVPGFPVPRPRARVAAGAPVALVAAGQTVVGRLTQPTEEERDREALRRVMGMLARRVHPDEAKEPDRGV